MAARLKVGKLTIVVFMTCLIWVWADLALVERHTLSRIPVTITKSKDPTVAHGFVKADGSVTSKVFIDALVLKGPASRIRQVRSQLGNETWPLELSLDPFQFNLTSPGQHPVLVSEFLRDNDRVRQMGLSVESCKPALLTVSVETLETRLIKVRCVDEDGQPVEGAVIDPVSVSMYVPKAMGTDTLMATVVLTHPEIARARTQPVAKTPFVELKPDLRQEAASKVRITTPSEQDRLKGDLIKNVTLGILMSQNLQADYKVNIQNLSEVVSSIRIRATAPAKQAYQRVLFQVLLEVSDDDAKATDFLQRDLIYNFPPEFSREIQLDQNKVKAAFRLERMAPKGESVPAAGP